MHQWDTKPPTSGARTPLLPRLIPALAIAIACASMFLVLGGG